MVDLLIDADPTALDLSGASFGGRPSTPNPAAFAWPRCRECDGAMSYLGRVPAPGAPPRDVLLFMCQHDPGLCTEWDAHAGGNRAVPVPVASGADLILPAPLPEPGAPGPTPYPFRAASRAPAPGADYDTARAAWSQAHRRPGRAVVGQLGGAPAWVQGDETPACDACRRPMAFVAQLEQGPDAAHEFNFGGGGCAYVFACACQPPLGAAKMLWQC